MWFLWPLTQYWVFHQKCWYTKLGSLHDSQQFCSWNDSVLRSSHTKSARWTICLVLKAIGVFEAVFIRSCVEMFTANSGPLANQYDVGMWITSHMSCPPKPVDRASPEELLRQLAPTFSSAKLSTGRTQHNWMENLKEFSNGHSKVLVKFHLFGGESRWLFDAVKQKLNSRTLKKKKHLLLCSNLFRKAFEIKSKLKKEKNFIGYGNINNNVKIKK